MASGLSGGGFPAKRHSWRGGLRTPPNGLRNLPIYPLVIPGLTRDPFRNASHQVPEWIPDLRFAASGMTRVLSKAPQWTEMPENKNRAA